MEFPTLEEFLLSDDRRNFHTSESWVYMYRVAKASFEQFGEEGPPVGSKVITIVNGHHGNGCDIRTFVGDYNTDLFKICRDQDQVSLVAKKTWWREIVSLDPLTIGWGKLPDRIRSRDRDLYDLVRFIVYN